MSAPDALNVIDGEARPGVSGEWTDKHRPADGGFLCRVARSGAADVEGAVAAARAAQPDWADRTVVERGDLLRDIALALRDRREELAMPHRTVMTVRQPVGVAGLIISFNTPLPNVAWKAFPAMLCGNSAVLKPSEHTPLSAQLFATTCTEVGLPGGVLNVVQGLGEAGSALVEHADPAQA